LSRRTWITTDVRHRYNITMLQAVIVILILSLKINPVFPCFDGIKLFIGNCHQLLLSCLQPEGCYRCHSCHLKFNSQLCTSTLLSIFRPKPVFQIPFATCNHSKNLFCFSRRSPSSPGLGDFRSLLAPGTEPEKSSIILIKV
jgi:hypothetical protein